MMFDIMYMLTPEVYGHPVSRIELIETHISWVVLTGDYAYKIKKPVDFGFLDFSSLDKRRDFCEQELRLNRRLAPEIYLDVVAITGTPDKPSITAEGEAFEYAVKMVQFPQSAQLDNMLADGNLDAEHMDAIARMTADFHQLAEVAGDSVAFGDNALVYQPVEENYIQINQHIDTAPYASTLDTLEQWSQNEFKKQGKILLQRKQDGYIRECHGDMHLRNMVWLNDRPMAFDCIEFNAALRWIDVISEVAFLVMDLQDRQQNHLANRFLNSYLEITGDYSGLSVLPFYLVYRAMVRAKVNALRLEQKDITDVERQQARAGFESYLALATSYTGQTKPKLIIMRGLSASGKSTVSQQLLDELGAIRIRSDIERKRLFEIDLTTNASEKIDTGLYSADASQQTYAKLIGLASAIIAAGYNVIVDAAFLMHAQREPFQKLAEHLGVPYMILQITAPDEVLRQRILNRKNDVSDADLEVLEYQISNREDLISEELDRQIIVNTAEAVDIESLIVNIHSL